MLTNPRPYRCNVCGWKGMAEPSPPLNDACCPQCGTWMLPETWLGTWGLALFLVTLTAGIVLFVAFFHQL